MKFIRITFRSIGDFFSDGGLMLASSLSYFAMMALVPFFMFTLALFGYFLGEHPDVYRFFFNKFVGIFPTATREITNEILHLISSKTLRRVSLVLYGLLSYQVFASLENSLNVIFKVKKKRSILFSVLLSIAVVTLVIVLLLLSFIAASVFPLLKVAAPYFPGLKIGRLTAFVLAYVVPFAVVLLTVTSIYMLLPKTKVRLPDAFRGACFTTILLEIAKHLFTWYVVSIAQLGKIYGPLTAFVVFLLWMF